MSEGVELTLRESATWRELGAQCRAAAAAGFTRATVDAGDLARAFEAFEAARERIEARQDDRDRRIMDLMRDQTRWRRRLELQASVAAGVITGAAWLAGWLAGAAS